MKKGSNTNSTRITTTFGADLPSYFNSSVPLTTTAGYTHSAGYVGNSTISAISGKSNSSSSTVTKTTSSSSRLGIWHHFWSVTPTTGNTPKSFEDASGSQTPTTPSSSPAVSTSIIPTITPTASPTITPVDSGSMQTTSEPVAVPSSATVVIPQTYQTTYYYTQEYVLTDTSTTLTAGLLTSVMCDSSSSFTTQPIVTADLSNFNNEALIDSLNGKASRDSKNKTKTIAGSVVGSIVAVLLLLLLIWGVFFKRRGSKRAKTTGFSHSINSTRIVTDEFLSENHELMHLRNQLVRNYRTHSTHNEPENQSSLTLPHYNNSPNSIRSKFLSNNPFKAAVPPRQKQSPPPIPRRLNQRTSLDSSTSSVSSSSSSSSSITSDHSVDRDHGFFTEMV